MSLTLRKTLDRYFKKCDLSNGTQAEYRSTLNKWENWNSNISIDQLGRKEISEFLDLGHLRPPMSQSFGNTYLGIKVAHTVNQKRDPSGDGYFIDK